MFKENNVSCRVIKQQLYSSLTNKMIYIQRVYKWLSLIAFALHKFKIHKFKIYEMFNPLSL